MVNGVSIISTKSRIRFSTKKHKKAVAADRESFSLRLNHALDVKGYPKKGDGRQRALGDLCGVTSKGARRWLEGVAIPSRPYAEKIVSVLDCSYEWLMRGRGEPWVLMDVPKLAIELKWSDVFAFAVKAKELSELGGDDEAMRRTLRVRDTSMEAVTPNKKSLHVGDLVELTFDPMVEHHEGDLVLARPDPKSDEVVLREYHTGLGQPYLQCLNPIWNDSERVIRLKMDGDSILAVVTGIQRSLK